MLTERTGSRSDRWLKLWVFHSLSLSPIRLCLLVCLSIHFSDDLSLSPFCLSMSLSLFSYLSLYMYLSISIYLSVSFHISPSSYLPIYPSIHLSIYLSIHPSIQPAIHPSIHQWVYLVLLPIHVSICPSFHHLVYRSSHLKLLEHLLNVLLTFGRLHNSLRLPCKAAQP